MAAPSFEYFAADENRKAIHEFTRSNSKETVFRAISCGLVDRIRCRITS
jgi:hypothetical protein